MRGPPSGYALAVVGALAGTAVGVGVAAWVVYLNSHLFEGESIEDLMEGVMLFFLLALTAGAAISAAGCGLGTFALLRLGGQPAAGRAAWITVAAAIPLVLLTPGPEALKVLAIAIAAVFGRHVSFPAESPEPVGATH